MAGVKIVDLPSITSPALGDVFAVSQSGVTYKESITQLGTLVLLLSGGTMTGDLILNADPSTNLQAATKQYADSLVAGFLPLSGGTMTGNLILNADPSTNLQAATKQYVDTAGGAFLPLSGGTMTGNLILNANPSTNLQAATKQYVDGFVPLSGGTMTGNLILNADPVSALGAATKQYVDGMGGAFLPLAGGTMTGSLILNADPVSSLEAATKQYVDTAGGAFLPLAGGTMTGTLVLNADPVSSLDAATKSYVDTFALLLAGGTMTGNLILNANPSTGLQAATKNYVDITALLLSGGTMTGNLILNADPSTNLQAATKQYVDNTALLLSGGTMTGNLILNADPTTGLQAATKQYVDTVAVGLNVQPACRVATTANLTATYSNGASGVGATLTNSGAMAAISIDGVSLSLNDRVLVKDQSITFQNGIYTVTTVGSGAANWVLTRATDYDTVAEIQPGDFVLIISGTVNMQTSWVQTDTVTTIGSDAINFSQFTANPSTFLKVASNLSDVANQSTAYSNIMPTTVTTAATATLTNNSKHIANRATIVTYTLPVTSPIGSEINIAGLGAGGWIVDQNSGQSIHVGSVTTTVGVGGSIASTNRYDSVRLMTIVADTEFVVMGAPMSAGLTII